MSCPLISGHDVWSPSLDTSTCWPCRRPGADSHFRLPRPRDEAFNEAAGLSQSRKAFRGQHWTDAVGAAVEVVKRTRQVPDEARQRVSDAAVAPVALGHELGDDGF